MKTNIKNFFVFLIFICLDEFVQAQVVPGNEWILINYFGTLDSAESRRVPDGQLFFMSGSHNNIPTPYFATTFGKNFKNHPLPKYMEAEFRLESYSGQIDSIEAYISVGDSVILERWEYFYAWYSFDLSSNSWGKMVWSMNPDISSTKVFNRVGFLFNIYAPASEKVSCKIILRDLTGIMSSSDSYLIDTTAVSDIDEESISSGFKLEQNYPNPFNPSTKILFSTPQREFVNLEVFNFLGQKVAILVNEEKLKGSYEIVFNALNLSSGIYFYRLKAGNFIKNKRMILLK